VRVARYGRGRSTRPRRTYRTGFHRPNGTAISLGLDPLANTSYDESTGDFGLAGPIAPVSDLRVAAGNDGEGTTRSNGRIFACITAGSSVSS